MDVECDARRGSHKSEMFDVGRLSQSEMKGWMAAMRIGGTDNAVAVELLSKWAQNGRSDLLSRRSTPSPDGHLLKRPRREGTPSSPAVGNPIDHIFQFHRALRRDFRSFESEIHALVERVEDGVQTEEWATDLQHLTGRFAFIWGLYQVALLRVRKCEKVLHSGAFQDRRRRDFSGTGV